MKKRPPVPWTAREDALICRMRKKGCDNAKVIAALPHRTASAVTHRIKRLINIGKIPSHRATWSPEEDTLICKLVAAGTPLASIAASLPSRTTPTDTGRGSAQALAPPTVEAVKGHIRHLRLIGRISDGPAPQPPAPWTDKEEAVLLDMRENGATLDQIAAKLSSRTRGATSRRIQQLLEAEEVAPNVHAPKSRHPWSPAEDELVAAMRAAGQTVEEMASALRRSVASVNGRIAARVRKRELGVLRVLAPRKKKAPRRKK